MRGAISLPIAVDEPSRRARPLPSSTPWLVAAFVAVCACFVGSSVYADVRMREIVQRSREISINAMPSIVELALIQKELRLVDQRADELAEGHDAPAPSWFDSALDVLDAAEARYVALPFFPHEQAIWSSVARDVHEAEAIARQVVATAATGDLATAEDRVKRALHGAVDRADAALDRLIAFDNAQGVVAAREVEATRARVTWIAIAMDGSSVLVTIAIALVAVRTMRRYAELREARARDKEPAM